MPTVVRWTVAGIGTFPINPKEGAIPQREKVLDVQGSTSPNGAPIIFQGRDRPRSFPFSGTILSKAHYDFMVAWYDSTTTHVVTDELGESYVIFLTVFKPKRKNRHSHPWAMDYDAEGLVIG